MEDIFDDLNSEESTNKHSLPKGCEGEKEESETTAVEEVITNDGREGHPS